MVGTFVSINGTKWRIDRNGRCQSALGQSYNVLTKETNMRLQNLSKDNPILDTINELTTIYNQLNQVTIGSKTGHLVGVGVSDIYGDYVTVKYLDGTVEDFEPTYIFEDLEEYSKWLHRL